MEEKLFSWETIDFIDAQLFQFYNCVLKVKIGDFEIGTRIPVITVDFTNGKMDLLDTYGHMYCETIKLELRIAS